MRRDEWARLAAPFPFSALDWWVAQLDREGHAARLEAVVSEAAVVERLDGTLGLEGWSKRLLPLGPDAVVCELELLGVRKSAVARSYGGLLDMQRVAGWAFGRAAALYGMEPAATRGAWVDFDPEAGEPLYLPEAGPPGGPEAGVEAAAIGEGPAIPSRPAPESAPASVAGHDAAEPGARDAAAPEAPEKTIDGEPAGGAPVPATATGRSEGQQVIERLVDRLRAEGLGRVAAALVVEHGGYGRSPEEARELYRKLRELLLQKGTAS